MGRLPDWIRDRQPLTQAGDFYLRAYFELATCRAYPGGPIPWHSVERFAAVHGLPRDVLRLLLDVTRFLDEVASKWHSANAPVKQDPQGGARNAGLSDRRRR